jgi:hypothetical protein
LSLRETGIIRMDKTLCAFIGAIADGKSRSVVHIEVAGARADDLPAAELNLA